jgi:hypothetical protein
MPFGALRLRWCGLFRQFLAVKPFLSDPSATFCDLSTGYCNFLGVNKCVRFDIRSARSVGSILTTRTIQDAAIVTISPLKAKMYFC